MGMSAGCTERDMHHIIRKSGNTYSPSSHPALPPNPFTASLLDCPTPPQCPAPSRPTATPPRNSKSGPGTRHYSNEGTDGEPPSPVSLQCIGVFALACRSICMVKFSAQGAFDRSCLLCSFCSISSKTNWREKRQELPIATLVRHVASVVASSARA